VASLSELIREKRDRIVERWKTHAARTVAGEGMPSKELIDSLPLFLDRLADAFDRAASLDEPYGELDVIAIDHGIQRVHLGFAPTELAREYSIVRDAIFEEALAARYVPDLREMWTLSRCLSQAIGTALTAFMAEREQERERLASEHLAFLAHELRNPLHAARIALQLLPRSDESRRAGLLGIVERGLHDALHRLDNTLADVRLRAHPQARLEEVDAAQLLRSARDEAMGIAESASVRMDVEVEPGLRLEADPRLLGSALGNLVMNAAKFSKRGGRVVLRARAVAQRVRFEVEDECGGLAPGTAEKLFDPFVQAGQDRSGFGLGLAIARQATEAHGGSLSVHDLPGKGCVFLLELFSGTS
jgi:signal transduction histidine kinase